MPLFALGKNRKKTKDRISVQSPVSPDQRSQNSSNNGGNNNNNSSRHITIAKTPTSTTPTTGASGALSTASLDSKNTDKTPARVSSDQPSSPDSSSSRVAQNSPPRPLPIPRNTQSAPIPNDMYSSSPFTTTPQPQSSPPSHPPPQPPPPLQPPNTPQSHLQNVVTGQYIAPPTPPSTARSGSIDDQIDILPPILDPSQPYQALKYPPPQDALTNADPYADLPSDAMIASSSGLLTPVPSGGEHRVIPSQMPSLQHQTNTPRSTKGKYAITDFSIQRTLGTGSFGRVHLVQSRHNSRFYAIKVLKKQQVVKMKQVEHTNDERAMLQIVKHPFLVNLWGTFQDSKHLYMVMDFIEGGELFSLLRKSQRFPNPVAKFYAAEVALAINYLHSMDVIYRDLKPENLLLDRHGHVKITDFGFAKRVPDITWTLCGTPDYLAPEVVASKGYNKSVDWWSLGILTFEMLAGYPPFYDQNPMKLYENIMNGRIKYPSYFDPLAKDFLSKLLTADLSKRFGNLKAGSADVFNHTWFAEVNWERLERREIDAPYVPPIRPGGGDASQFERYDEESEDYGDCMSKDVYGHLFMDF